MPLKDEASGVYAYVLGVAGVALAASIYANPQTAQVTGIALQDIDTASIETASVPAPQEGLRAWNYPQIPWRSYESGMAEMARSNKPAVLVLQADWCLVCRTYQKQFAEPEIIERADDFVFILADVERQPELQRRYDIDGDYIPRTFVLGPRGRIENSGGAGAQRFFVDPSSPEPLRTLMDTAAPATE